MKIRTAQLTDAPAIAEIYNWYISNTTITFETEPVTAGEMQTRINDKLLHYDWLVGEIDGKILGYAYFGSFRTRSAYSHTVESTIYLANVMKGKGYGIGLYKQLIASAREKNFREMVGVVALPNPESMRFHQKLGFTEIGIMPKIGYKFNHYLDVAFLQIHLY